MDTEIKFQFVRSLKRIALVKTAILLWNGIQSEQSRTFEQFSERWREIETRIKVKVLFLQLPKVLEGEMKSFVKPIGFQILKWLFSHQDIIPLSIALINKFYWTHQGTIDRKKTARCLFIHGHKGIPAAVRFNIACTYCLTDDIPVLWNEMTPNVRRRFGASRTFTDFLSTFWTYRILGDTGTVNRLIRTGIGHNDYGLYPSLFLLSTESGNVVASEFFFKKLSEEERNDVMVSTATDLAVSRYIGPDGVNDVKESHYSDVLVFLLSVMNDEERIEVFESDPSSVLFCLADWPFQDVLIPAMTLAYEFLLKDAVHRVAEAHFEVLESIVHKESKDSGTYIYNRLFTQIWNLMPENIKEYVASDDSCEYLLLKLFWLKDQTNILLILDKASPEIKRSFTSFLKANHTLCRSRFIKTLYQKLGTIE